MIGHARHRTGRVTDFEAEVVLTKNSPANNVGFTPTDTSAVAWGAEIEGNPGFVLTPGLWQITMTGNHTVNYANPNQAPRPIGPIIESVTGGPSTPIAGRRIVYNGTIGTGGDPEAALNVPQGTSDIRNGLFAASDPDRFNFIFGPNDPDGDPIDFDAGASFFLTITENCSFKFYYDPTPGGLTISYTVTDGLYTVTARRMA